MQNTHADKKIGAIIFGDNIKFSESTIVKNLSFSKNYQEAAVHLFSFLRELDETDVDVIITDLLPEQGLGLAINDRLRRAAAL